MTLILSNRAEMLADALVRDLYGASLHPLARKMVIVPSLRLKEYLMLFMAERYQIAFGLEIVTLPEAWSALFSKRIPSFLELSLEIEKQIVSEQENVLLKPLMEYLERRHLPKFCDELSQIFLRYGMYGEDFLEGWQQVLWQKIFASESRWTYLARELKNDVRTEMPIHLFGLSALPESAYAFFKKLEAKFYLFSPCELFWEDICSDQERIRLQKSLQKKGVKQTQQEALNGYLKNTNPLLANWGRLGRAALSYLDLPSDEIYVPGDEHLLGSLQNDLLTMRDPDQEEKKAWKEGDLSITLHGSPSLLREVEALFYTLVNTAEKEIVVLAPDICVYAPYIHMVFGAEGSCFDYAISDLEASMQPLQDLLALPKERFSSLALLKLFSHSSFLEKAQLTSEDVDLMRTWIEKAGITWGFDAEQKAGFLHPMNPDFKAEEAGSWQHGFKRLMLGLVMVSPEEEEFPFLVSGIEGTEVELLGKLIQLLTSLNEDLRPLYAQEEKTLSAWLSYFERLSKTYFIESETEALMRELRSLEFLEDAVYPAASMERVLSYFFRKKNGSFHATHRQAIHFGSLHTGAVVPAKVIALLGMQEGVFPRDEKVSSLSALKEFSSKRDEDRALFLEILFAAKSHVILSYQRINPEDGKEELPSILIQELFSYLDKAYEPAPSKNITFSYSSLPFDRKLPALLPKDLRAAQIYYHSQKPAEPLWNVAVNSAEKKEDLIIQIKDLAKLAKHPIRFYLNQALGIYIDGEEEDLESRDLLLSSLNQSLFRKAIFKTPLEELLRSAEHQGRLPTGVFKDVAELRIREDVEGYEEQLALFGVQKEEIFSVELTAATSCLKRVGKSQILLPPLAVGKTYYITGKLENLSSQGMLIHSAHHLKDILKVWPLFLVFLHLQELGCEPCLLFMKTGKKVTIPMKDQAAVLREYLSYYELCQRNMSPLMPDWAAALLKGESKELQKLMRSSHQFTSFTDLYLEWFALREPASCPHALWSEPLKKVFSPLLSLEEDA